MLGAFVSRCLNPWASDRAASGCRGGCRPAEPLTNAICEPVAIGTGSDVLHLMFEVNGSRSWDSQSLPAGGVRLGAWSLCNGLTVTLLLRLDLNSEHLLEDEKRRR